MLPWQLKHWKAAQHFRIQRKDLEHRAWLLQTRKLTTAPNQTNLRPLICRPSFLVVLRHQPTGPLAIE